MYISRLIFQQHSTFFVQTIYFALVLVENIILCCTPFFLFNDSGSNRALECLGDDKDEASEKIYQCIALMIAASMGGWICHTIYYTQMGHPWGAINGPELRKNRFSFYKRFHFGSAARFCGNFVKYPHLTFLKHKRTHYQTDCNETLN